MQTLRIINQSWFIFLGSLLGSIFGIMGAVGTLMGITESFYDKYVNIQKEKLRADLNYSKYFSLKSQFQKLEYKKYMSKRVLPYVSDNQDTAIFERIDRARRASGFTVNK